MAMLLKGDDGTEFELAFIQDDFQDMQDGSGNANWTTLSFRVGTPDESWEESAPCMNLFEIKNLAEWLEAVGSGEPEVSEVELLEPELKFSIVRNEPDAVTVRVGFHLDNRPEEFQVDAPTDEADHVDIHIPRRAVRAAAEHLREDLSELDLPPADDLLGEVTPGMLGIPDANLNMIDQIDDEPPGTGVGEDDAGER
jgi:hypothetical protein